MHAISGVGVSNGNTWTGFDYAAACSGTGYNGLHVYEDSTGTH
jgi:hypothetical protein